MVYVLMAQKASTPSKAHLLSIDFAIVLLNMVLVTAAYETSLQASNPNDPSDPLLPIPPSNAPATSLPGPSSHLNKDSSYVLDLRLSLMIDRLRHPPQSDSQPPWDPSNLIPLPATTPLRSINALHALLRGGRRNGAREAQARRERERTQNRRGPPERTLPGGLDATEVT